jgi:hypothetical protein
MPPSVSFPWTEAELATRVSSAVESYWRSRGGQSRQQQKRGVSDTGTRGEVTGGQHLNGFLKILVDAAEAAGFSDAEIRLQSGVELPGYFRPQKRWDMVVTRADRLCAAIELKSQSGSFGNNFNNRTEEAVGTSTDFWTAFREGAMGSQAPWLGYFFLLEDSRKSTAPVRLKESKFRPFPVFHQTSYARRYEILCERLVLERKFTRTALMLTPRGKKGGYSEPVADLGFHGFVKSLYAQLLGCA